MADPDGDGIASGSEQDITNQMADANTLKELTTSTPDVMLIDVGNSDDDVN